MKFPAAIALLLVLLAAGCGDAGSPHAATAAPSGTKAPAPPRPEAILFFGTITEGPGVDLTEAYPVLIRQQVDARHLPYVVVNAGLRGETTAGGRSRVGEVLRQRSVRVFVLGLGGNDGPRGLSLQATRRNLQAIVDTVRRHAPHASILFAGMPVPAVRGPAYTADFNKLYTETARYNHAVFIPLPTTSKRGRASTTPAGIKTSAFTAWQRIAPLLSGPRSADSPAPPR